MSIFYDLSEFESCAALHQWLKSNKARIEPNVSGDLDCAYWIMPQGFSWASETEPAWGPISFYYDASPGQGFAFEFNWGKPVPTFSETEFVEAITKEKTGSN